MMMMMMWIPYLTQRPTVYKKMCFASHATQTF